MGMSKSEVKQVIWSVWGPHLTLFVIPELEDHRQRKNKSCLILFKPWPQAWSSCVFDYTWTMMEQWCRSVTWLSAMLVWCTPFSLGDQTLITCIISLFCSFCCSISSTWKLDQFREGQKSKSALHWWNSFVHVHSVRRSSQPFGSGIIMTIIQQKNAAWW